MENAQANFVESVRGEYRARAEANMEPLPGPLADAFGPPIVIHGITVRPVVHYDLVILRQLNSPLYLHMLEMGKPDNERKEIKYSDDDGYLLVHQFTNPIAVIREQLERGHDYLKACALAGTAYRLPPVVMAALIPAVLESFKRSFEPAIKYGEEKKDGESFSQSPKVPKMASAGGSTTFADLSAPMD
jgi:hypothetical protein